VQTVSNRDPIAGVDQACQAFSAHSEDHNHPNGRKRLPGC
jgi:hypothetical protein